VRLLHAAARAPLTAGFEDDLVRIARQPEESAARRHDLVVIGGGIYGVALAFEAGRHGYRALLLERDDFGGGTSWSSLRILHGGLRYLQTLDLRRFRESVAERRWFLRHFPDLIRPLPCLMPLYERGYKRPSLMRLALACNDLLSIDRNRGLEAGVKLGRGGVLSARETARIFPQVDRRGLAGGALWCDAVMLSSERVLIELLGWACRGGATALNYVEAERAIVDGEGIAGLEVRDRVTGRTHRFWTSRVINATGSWSRLVARRMDRDIAPLFRPTLAFNLLINRPPIADVAVAIYSPHADARVFFILPWKGRLLAGTCHCGLPETASQPAVTEEQVSWFLGELNVAVPCLNLVPEDVVHIYAGLLPGRRRGKADLATRAVIYDHGAHGGPQGLYSISGVKFTTARRVAEDTLRTVFRRKLRATVNQSERPTPLLDVSDQTLLSTTTPFDGERSAVEGLMRRIAQEEAALHLEDLLLRRLDSATVLANWTKATEVVRHALPFARSDAGLNTFGAFNPPPAS
jgi:glycerol-3-phosphate dehydrogenase